MALKLYDEALINKLKSWTVDSKINIYGPNETKRLFEVTADKTNDAPIKLPIICLSRDAGYELQQSSKRPMSHDGVTIEASILKSMQLNAIPVTVHYQLDLYTRYFEEADDYSRNLIFNLVNSPKIEFELPYQDKKWLVDSYISLQPTVTDNSNISERFVPGQFTRLTFNIDLNDAYLFDLRLRNNWSIDADLILENTTKE